MTLFIYGIETGTVFAASTKYRIVVDVSDQRVYVYNRSSGKRVKSMICSTGKSKTPTPKGNFRISSSRSRWYYFKKYDVYAQYMTRFNGPYLFHSVLYRHKDTDTLIKSSYNNLGSRASKGCVRLKPSDAKWIYTNCKSGTPVKVRS